MQIHELEKIMKCPLCQKDIIIDDITVVENQNKIEISFWCDKCGNQRADSQFNRWLRSV